MLLQPNITGSSGPLMVCRKAQCAGKSRSLGQRCNTVARHQGTALRVSGSAPMDCVAPLGKDRVIAGEPRLAMNADPLTEPGNIRLKEH